MNLELLEAQVEAEPAIIRDGPPIVIPRDARTLEGFRKWFVSDEFPERGRICYIEGAVFIDMSPERIETHTKLKGQITTDLAVLVESLDLGTVYLDGAGYVNEAADLATEPDAMFASWRTLKTGRLKLLVADGKEMVGTPDMVLEVISRYSVKKDTRDLRRAYHRAGIPEYWMADALGDDVDFQILVRQRTGYKPAPQKAGWVYSRVFERYFRLTRRRDRAGYWRYKLESRK
jgi:Uma2 family endonuclease